jgi:hypothetical protein
MDHRPAVKNVAAISRFYRFAAGFFGGDKPVCFSIPMDIGGREASIPAACNVARAFRMPGRQPITAAIGASVIARIWRCQMRLMA